MGSNQENSLPVIVAKSGRRTRRELIGQLLAGLGAGAAWPLNLRVHSILEKLGNEVVLNEVDRLGNADWKPVFLDAQQNESLLALAEIIVPGSAKAEVNRFIDLLLSVDRHEHQHQFVQSLAAFEAEAQKRFANHFSSLGPNQQNDLLTDASQKFVSADSSTSSADRETTMLFGHFENLKAWVSGAYYCSEAGMRELGWNGEYAFEKFPGCQHAEGHH